MHPVWRSVTVTKGTVLPSLCLRLGFLLKQGVCVPVDISLAAMPAENSPNSFFILALNSTLLLGCPTKISWTSLVFPEYNKRADCLGYWGISIRVHISPNPSFKSVSLHPQSLWITFPGPNLAGGHYLNWNFLYNSLLLSFHAWY